MIPSTSVFGAATTIPFSASSQVFKSGRASVGAFRQHNPFSSSPQESSSPGIECSYSFFCGGIYYAGKTSVMKRTPTQNSPFAIRDTFVQPTFNHFPPQSPTIQKSGFGFSSTTGRSTPSTILPFSGFTTSGKTESARPFQSFPSSFQTSPLQPSPSQVSQNNRCDIGNLPFQSPHHPFSPKNPTTGWTGFVFSSSTPSSTPSTTIPFSGFFSSEKNEFSGPFQNPPSTAQNPTVLPSLFNGFTSHGNKPAGLSQTPPTGQMPPLQSSQRPDSRNTRPVQQAPPSHPPPNISALTSLVNTQPSWLCQQAPVVQFSQPPQTVTPRNTQISELLPTTSSICGTKTDHMIFGAQTQNATGNYQTQQKAPSSSTAGTSNISGQGIPTKSSVSQHNLVGQTVPTINLSGTLRMPQISIGHVSSTAVIQQYGISRMLVCENPIPVRRSTLLAPRHLSQRRIQLPARKYHCTDGLGPKVRPYSQNEAAEIKPKCVFLIPRENPRALVVNPTEQWSSGGISTEKQFVSRGSHSQANEYGDPVKDGHSGDQNQATLSPFGPANNVISNHNYDDQEVKGSPRITNPGNNTSNIMIEDGTEIEALMPKLSRADYYTEPHIQELAAKERIDPGFCCRVKDFVVGRWGYGSIKFDGETDVRGIDLELVIQFNNREVIVYEDECMKPPIGQGLNKPSEVTLLNVKCMNKKTGQQYTEGSKVEKYKEMLVAKSREQGAEFVSYDAVKGEWKFKVKHFSRYGLADED